MRLYSNVPVILTKPQWQALGVEEQALSLSLVGWRHIEVTADDSLQMTILPVQVTGFHGSREHCSSRPGQ